MRFTALIIILLVTSTFGIVLSYNPSSTPQSPLFPPSAPPYVGRVCFAPGALGPVCPHTIPSITTDSSGHLNVSVTVLGSTNFNALGISVHWDPTFINSTQVFPLDTILPTPIVEGLCINGGGSGCSSHDGPGVATVQLEGGNVTAPASGRLFSMAMTGFPNTDPHLGFTTGCTTINVGRFNVTGSVPNTNLCLVVGSIVTTICTTICIQNLVSDPEGIQSQSLGNHLPTAFSPNGTITGTLNSGGLPNNSTTFVMPFSVTLPGNITVWKAQFTGTRAPVGMQIKVLRRTSNTTLTVIEAGPVHNPTPVLFNRVPGYPFVLSQQTVIPIYTDSFLTVSPGDLIGLTIISDPALGSFDYPLVNIAGTRFVTHNVPLNGTIDLSDPFTGRLNGTTPALEVSIQPNPASLDTSGDGIPDFVALSPEMRALGVDPCRKTVLVQIDYMVSPDGVHTFRPLQAALETVTSAFDAAPVSAVSSCPYQGYPLKSSGVNLVVVVQNQIPYQSVLNFSGSQPQSFDSIKAAFFDTNRAHYFHYGLFVNMTSLNKRSGIGEIYGNDFIVSLGGWHNVVGTLFEQAGTFMHELGHNLGLDHGGADAINRKPNYLSVMSYEHQVVGILSHTSSGDVFRFDFSREQMPTLNESNLNDWTVLSHSNDYTKWACPDHRTVKMGLVNSPIDWDCDTQFTSPVSNDVNNDTMMGILTGYNDWANLRFNFVDGPTFNVGCSSHCDIGCSSHCDIGCSSGCDIGCKECAFGQSVSDELNFTTAQTIEASWATFEASTHHTTATTVSCNPSSIGVNTPTKCTASVSDTNTTSIVTPTGTMSFESSMPGTFSPTTCSLAGTGATASCTVNLTSPTSSVGLQNVTSGYSGDANHLGTSSSTPVMVLPESITISKFFTSGDLNPLQSDTNGNPIVNVVIAKGQVRSTNPGQVLAWVNITNTGTIPIQSLSLNDTLPVDWVVSPAWMPSIGAIHVYYANGTSLSNELEITQPSTISVSSSNPETVQIAISSFNATLVGHPLFPGQSILLQVKISYGLIGTSQSPSSYPRTYADAANGIAWSQPSFSGTQTIGTGTASFKAYAKIVNAKSTIG